LRFEAEDSALVRGLRDQRREGEDVEPLWNTIEKQQSTIAQLLTKCKWMRWYATAEFGITQKILQHRVDGRFFGGPR